MYFCGYRCNNGCYWFWQDALPLIDQIQFEEPYRRAFEHVFGKTLLCKDIATATNYSNSDNLDCITIDGKFFVGCITWAWSM